MPHSNSDGQKYDYAEGKRQALSAKFGVIQDGYALIDLPLSHQEIANMLGASREAVSAVMSELAKEGVVKVSRLSVQLAVTILEENIPRNSSTH